MSTPKAVSDYKAISDYMREMQARSAKSRWAGMTAAEKSAAMKALRAKGKRKLKARPLRQNGADQRPAPENDSQRSQ
jgi:predicted Fe-S protein YdhL (DUF1289 family)